VNLAVQVAFRTVPIPLISRCKDTKNIRHFQTFNKVIKQNQTIFKARCSVAALQLKKLYFLAQK
jgi:cell fate (sporulation/competence/biofilm development) regulator YmcA (YheA/YmcA/DUF963 family)